MSCWLRLKSTIADCTRFSVIDFQKLRFPALLQRGGISLTPEPDRSTKGVGRESSESQHSTPAKPSGLERGDARHWCPATESTEEGPSHPTASINSDNVKVRRSAIRISDSANSKIKNNGTSCQLLLPDVTGITDRPPAAIENLSGCT